MDDTGGSFYDLNELESATECTGLIPAAVDSEAEAESYESLYPIHKIGDM